jgi:hypothetical protein
VSNFADLEKRLNSDDALRQRFLHDPVDVFRQEGIHLSPDMEKHLSDSVKNATTHPAPAGAMHGTAAKPNVRVEFGVSVHF